jgi:uncharacterized protein YkwD
MPRFVARPALGAALTDARPVARAALAFAIALAAPTRAAAYGESDADGRPNNEERLTLVLTNQIRQAPHAWPGWDTRKATPEARGPLAGHAGLFEAARAHGDDLAASKTFSHDSSDGTPFSTRIRRYFDGPGAGENIYTSTERGAIQALTRWMTSDGHRANILDPSWTLLGTGYVRGGALGNLYVQDFGLGGAADAPTIPAAALALEAGLLVVRANVFDAAGLSPRRVVAAIDDACATLERVVGEPGHETWRVAAARPSGTAAVAVYVETDAGRVVRYPTTGALLTDAAEIGRFDADAAPSGCGLAPQTPSASPGGCSVSGAEPSWLGLVALAALGRRAARRAAREVVAQRTHGEA